MVASNVWTGRDRYALDICRHFSSQGWRVAVLTRDAKAVDKFFEPYDIELIHVPLDEWTDWSAILRLRREIRTNAPGRTIIHLHRYRDALRALIARALSGKAGKSARIILTRHTSKRASLNPVYRFIYRHLDAHLFMSEFSLNRFRIGRLNNDERNIVVAEGSLNPADNVLSGTIADEPERGPVIATYYGRLLPGKGVETLIDAMSLLRDVKMRLRIVGTGNPDYVDTLRRRAQNRGVMDKIDWRNHYYETGVGINESHFGIFPALTPECFGLHLLQFMARGRTVITTTGSAPADYLTSGEDSLLVMPADVGGLAAAIRLLVTNPGERRRLGKNAAETFNRRFPWQKFIDKIERIYLR